MLGNNVRFWLYARTWIVAIGLISGASGAEPLPICLKGLDPVALTSGERLPGRPELAAEHGRYRYCFATAENLAAFKSAPDHYAVQYAGACAKMGPLTGLGSPERFAVHDGRIYLFASESCLAAFQAAPGSFVERDDPPPAANADSLARGRELIGLALRGFGGEDKVDAVQSLLLETRRSYRDGDQTREHSITWTAAFPDRFARSDAWHGGRTAMVVVGDRGWFQGTKQAEPYQEIERRFLRRELRRQPLVLLKARREPGFQAVAAGRGQVGERPVELLTIHYDGVNHTLGLDPATGRVLSFTYRGRLSGPIVSIMKTYDDFRDIGGVSLPFIVQAASGDQPPASKTVFSRVSIDAAFPDSLFEPPHAD